MALRFLGLCLRYSSASSSFASIISLSFPDITLTAVGWFSLTLYFLRFAWLQCRFFNPLRLSIEVPSDVPGSFTCNCISRVLLCLTSLLKAREKYLSGTYPVHILSLGTLPVYKFIYSSLFAHPRHTFELPKPSTAPSAAQKDIMRRLVLAQRWWDIDTFVLHPQQHKSSSMLLLVGLLSKPRSSSFGSGWGYGLQCRLQQPSHITHTCLCRLCLSASWFLVPGSSFLVPYWTTMQTTGL